MMLVPLDLREASLGRVNARTKDRRLGSLSDMSDEVFDEGLDSRSQIKGAFVMRMVAEGSEGVGVKSRDPDKGLITPMVGFYLLLEESLSVDVDSFPRVKALAPILCQGSSSVSPLLRPSDVERRKKPMGKNGDG
jgi:hypothetical protein